MLPMGTIMATSMVLGVVFATRLPPFKLVQKLPRELIVTVAVFLLAAGAWNVFWYALRHVGEFWGTAALIAGVLQIVSAGYIGWGDRMPLLFQQIRSVAVLALLCCAMLYSWTIYTL